ncbi:MAG: bacteriohemerythrin [Bryobacterales bacterium]|nr:bacteriohemerythrin [Bryobacterales bacterium]
MPVLWETRFETGDHRIDDQHKRLFEFVNKLENVIAAPAIKADEVDDIVSFLSTYVLIHFVCEESAMMARRCAIAERNKEAHKKFLAFFGDFKTRYAQRGADRALLQELCNAANQWLVNHICRIDVQLREAIHNQHQFA